MLTLKEAAAKLAYMSTRCVGRSTTASEGPEVGPLWVVARRGLDNPAPSTCDIPEPSEG